MALQHGFMAKGIPSNVALKDSYQALEYMVMKQASVLSYMDVFLYIGLMFLICVPFVLLVKGNRKQKIDLAEAMH
jgi:DHA2 family multidrug resistance protein